MPLKNKSIHTSDSCWGPLVSSTKNKNRHREPCLCADLFCLTLSAGALMTVDFVSTSYCSITLAATLERYVKQQTGATTCRNGFMQQHYPPCYFMKKQPYTYQKHSLPLSERKGADEKWRKGGDREVERLHGWAVFSNGLTLSAEAWRSEVKVFGEPSECLKDQFSSLMKKEQEAENDTPATVSAGDGNSTQLALPVIL